MKSVGKGSNLDLRTIRRVGKCRERDTGPGNFIYIRNKHKGFFDHVSYFRYCSSLGKIKGVDTFHISER